MTHLDSLKRTSHQADLTENEPKSVKTEPVNQIPKLYEMALISFTKSLNHRPLHQRVAVIQETQLTPALKMKLLQPVMEEKLTNTKTAASLLTIFHEIKMLCTIEDEESKTATFSYDNFHDYFAEMMKTISDKRLEFLDFREFDKMIKDPSQDLAILEMMGLWYVCKVERSEDFRFACNEVKYITKIETNFTLDTEDFMALLNAPFYKDLIIG